MVELLLIPAIGYEVLTCPLASSCSIRPQAVVCHESATALGAGHRLWSSDSAIGYSLLNKGILILGNQGLERV